MPNPHELSTPTLNTEIPVEPIELPPEITDMSAIHRIVRASKGIFSDTLKIMVKGDPIEAVREGANHL